MENELTLRKCNDKKKAGDVPFERLAEMLRVDHAGEYGAVHIYRGQRAVFERFAKGAQTAATLEEMQAHEEEHLRFFTEELLKRGIRPSALCAFWRLAGFSLGAITALMGEKQAHSATSIVETVIGEHYAEQLEQLEPLCDEEKALCESITRIRDEELEHKAHADAHGATEALGYPLLKAFISQGCRLAIAVAQKI